MWPLDQEEEDYEFMFYYLHRYIKCSRYYHAE